MCPDCTRLAKKIPIKTKPNASIRMFGVYTKNAPRQYRETTNEENEKKKSRLDDELIDVEQEFLGLLD
jgi:hypothetical protein